MHRIFYFYIGIGGLVGVVGLEPTRGEPQRILSPFCLPIPAYPHIMLPLSLVGGSKPNHGFRILDFRLLMRFIFQPTYAGIFLSFSTLTKPIHLI